MEKNAKAFGPGNQCGANFRVGLQKYVITEVLYKLLLSNTICYMIILKGCKIDLSNMKI